MIAIANHIQGGGQIIEEPTKGNGNGDDKGVTTGIHTAYNTGCYLCEDCRNCTVCPECFTCCKPVTACNSCEVYHRCPQIRASYREKIRRN
jgi:hypothetical protein